MNSEQFDGGACLQTTKPPNHLTMKTIDRIGSAFLRRIVRRMKELGVSQTELARRMNVSRPYITKVLRQDVNFSFRTAAKLANALKDGLHAGTSSARGER